MSEYVISFEKLRIDDVPAVGGKNASLGEMISQLAAKGVRVPGGFATTADAYREFLAQDGLDDRINAELDALNVDDTQALAVCGNKIREWIIAAPFPKALNDAIAEHYKELTASSGEDMTFAVRSSATAEDLPDASFAGQQESFLNIRGLDNILHAIKEVFASLYNDRAISYRVHKLHPRRCGPFSRRATHGTQQPGKLRCYVHHGYGIRLYRRSVHYLVLRSR
jgi:pyruvate, water dikinase